MTAQPQLPERLRQWLFRVNGPEPSPIRLGQRRIFVLPTRFCLALGATLLAMLLASINYGLSLGFAFTFLIGSVAWISIHHAFRNLVELSISPGRSEPVFAGTPARFGVVLHNPTLRPRAGLKVWPVGHPNDDRPFDIPAAASCVCEVSVTTQHRGWLALPRLTVETRHPLGLIRGWSLFQPDQQCLVYPAPEADAPPLPLGDDPRPGQGSRGRGRDDFSGLRHHQPADSPRHVAWKNVARGGPWRTKEFDGIGRRAVWLDWEMLPTNLDVETRLARLCRWVLNADAAAIDYGLRLPGTVLTPARGPAHRHACLTALALLATPPRTPR